MGSFLPHSIKEDITINTVTRITVPYNTKTRLRTASPHDALTFAPRLRKADKEEIWAKGNITPFYALFFSIVDSSPNAWAFIDATTEEIIAIGGIKILEGEEGEGIALPWLLASPAVHRVRNEFHRACKFMLDELWVIKKINVLFNVVHSKNTTSIQWLGRLGFTFIHHDEPLGTQGELFHSFAMRRGEGVYHV